MTWTLEVASNAAASAWTDRTSVVDRTSMALTGVAFRAEVDAGSGFDLAADSGAVSLPARRVVRVTEDATTPSTTLFRGRIVSKAIGRGTMFSGDAMQFDVMLQDSNAHLQGIIVDGWSRPAETDVARITALRSTFLAGSPRTSTNLAATYIESTSPVNLPAKRYDDTDPAGVVADVLGQSGKDCFVTVDDELFYGPTTSVAYAAGLSITDQGADSIVSFAPEWEGGAGDQDGGELVTGIKLKYEGGSATATDATAETNHDHWRSTWYDDGAKAANASARAATQLANQKAEERRYRCSITLAASQVGLVKRGQTLSFRAAATDVLTPLTLRVVRLAWSEAGPGTWKAALELGFPKKMVGRINRAPRPPGEDLNAVITVENGGLEAGSALTGLTWWRDIRDYIFGDQGWELDAGPIIGTWLPTNDSWPQTPCGLSLGAWRGWAREYAALVATAPADADWIMLRMPVVVGPLDHGQEGFLAGTIAAIHGPVVVAGGLAGATPQASDIDASGNIAGGMGQAQLGQGITAVSGDVDISRNAVPWGSAFRMLFAPGWFLTTEYICVQDDTSTNSANCGAVNLAATMTPYKLAAGAYGWLTAAPKGTQNGVNRVFDLIGGYTHVSDVLKNGLAIPADAWRADDNLTLETIGWAPLATDHLVARYYVPK